MLYLKKKIPTLKTKKTPISAAIIFAVSPAAMPTPKLQPVAPMASIGMCPSRQKLEGTFDYSVQSVTSIQAHVLAARL